MSESTKTILFLNQKGGVGKTTLSVNIAQILGERFGKKVIVIDNDVQSSASFLANLPVNEYGALEKPETGHPDLGSLIGNIQWDGFEALPEYEDLEEAIVTPTYMKRVRAPGTMMWADSEEKFAFDILGGYNKDLSLCEMIYVAQTEEPFILQPGNRKYARYLLKMVVDRIKKYYDYDYIIIDTAPSLGILTINALLASDYLIIPCQPDMLSTIGLDVIIQNLIDLNRFVPNFNILGVLFNMYAGTKGDDELIREVQEYGSTNGINVFSTRIPRVNQMKTMSREEGIAVMSNAKPFRMFRESMISLAQEVISQCEKESEE